MRERDESLYLADILDAARRILSYTAGGRAEFFADPKTQDAVIRNLEDLPPLPPKLEALASRL